MLLQTLSKQGLISPPKWLVANMQYLTVVGSEAFGVTSDGSDTDMYGFAIPPKYLVFPHLTGEVPGFGRQQPRFDVWQEHGVKQGDRQYDFAIYGIVKFFDLVMNNNPNMIDALFTPRRCVIHSTQVGELVREHRREFLHKGAWHKYKGYAYSSMNKIKDKPLNRFAALCKAKNIPFSVTLKDVLVEIENREALKRNATDVDG